MTVRSLRAPRRRKHRVPRGFATAVHTAPPPPRRWNVALAIAVGLLVHVAIGALAVFAPSALPKAVTREVPVVVARRIEPPPKPPEPPPEPPPPLKQARAPRPPAQAGKVVAAKPDPSAPVDMTGFSMPVGESQSYVGGFTSPKGTSPAAAPTPDPRPAPRAPPPGPDLSRAPQPADPDWNCQWPDDQRDGDLNEARVAIRVAVDVDGAPERVDVTNSPSASFSEAARRCALGASYQPALDRKGQRIAATTPLFLVHFFR